MPVQFGAPPYHVRREAAIFWRAGAIRIHEACEGPAVFRSDDYHVTASYRHISGYLAGPGKLRKTQEFSAFRRLLQIDCKSSPSTHRTAGGTQRRPRRPSRRAIAPDPLRDVTQLFGDNPISPLDERYKDRWIAELRSPLGEIRFRNAPGSRTGAAGIDLDLIS